MLKAKYHLLLPAVALAVALSSCAHTKIISTWQDPGYQGHPKKIFVYGISKSPDVRAIFENQLVEQFTERGLEALDSHRFLPDSLIFDREAVKKLVKEKEIDTIFLAHPVSSKDIQTLRPGQVSYSAAVYSDPDNDFFVAVSGAAYQPGSYAEESNTMEMIIYDVNAKKRIWSALAEVYVSNTRVEEIAPAVKLIMKALVDSKIIP